MRKNGIHFCRELLAFVHFCNPFFFVRRSNSCQGLPDINRSVGILVAIARRQQNSCPVSNSGRSTENFTTKRIAYCKSQVLRSASFRQHLMPEGGCNQVQQDCQRVFLRAVVPRATHPVPPVRFFQTPSALEVAFEILICATRYVPIFTANR